VDDVNDPIPDFCTDAVTGIDDCNNFSSPDCDDGPLFVDNPNCQACVIECLKDRTVDFMIGNTDILPVSDPMGDPTTVSSGGNTIGFNCPDEVAGTGSFLQCSVRLGDIFHSTPVLVGSPSPLFFDSGFQAFAAKFLKRSAAVYTGANDGFLHSFHAGEFVNAGPGSEQTNPFTLEDEAVPFFNEGSGLEVFGFAPPSFLRDSRSDNDPFIFDEGDPDQGPSPDYRVGDFKSFVIEESIQRAFFDGSPTIGDIWIDAYKNGIPEDPTLCADSGGITINTPDGNLDLCGREWHTMLISGFRNGGGGFTALDVTNFGCGRSDGVPNPDGTNKECLTPGTFLTGNGAPDYPAHLWTKFDTDFGNSWSRPVFGRIQLSVNDGINPASIVDRWVVFVGGGKDPLDDDPREGGVESGRGFYVIDIATGQTIFKFHPDDPIDNDDNVIANTSDMVCEMSARVGVFDINADGFIDLVYGGDTCGRMWRFDVSLPLETSSSISQTGLNGTAVLEAPDWTGEVVFCTGDCTDGGGNLQLPPFTDDGNPNNDSDLPSIYFAPTLVFDDAGQRHVIFVTGNRNNPTKIADFDDMGTSDPSDDTPIPGTFEFGSLYNFIDSYVPAFLAGGAPIPVSTPLKTEQQLVNDNQVIEIESFVGGTIPPELKAFQVNPVASFDNARGEFVVRFPDNLVLTDPKGEKGFGSPTVINRVLVFTTFAPDQSNNNPCVAAFGEGRLFAIDFLTGEAALARIPGAQTTVLQGVTSQSDADQIAGVKVAEGIPSAAQITYGVRGSAILTIAFSGSPAAGGAQFLIWELPPFPSRTQTLFWEEII